VGMHVQGNRGASGCCQHRGTLWTSGAPHSWLRPTTCLAEQGPLKPRRLTRV
jgi:hypothetical protein